jgi:hypothetical protein
MEVLFYGSTPSGAIYSDVPAVAYNATTGGSTTIASTAAAPLFTASYSNVPSGVAFLTPRRQSAGLLLGDHIQNPTASQAAQHYGGVGSEARRITTFTAPTNAQQIVFDDASPSATNYSLDASTALLQWLGVPSVNTTTRVVTTPTSTGPTGDLAVAFLAYGRPGNGVAHWLLFMEAPTTFTLPTIPASVADMTIVSLGTPNMSVFEFASVSGYDVARLDPHALYRNSDWGIPRLTGVRASLSPGP